VLTEKLYHRLTTYRLLPNFQSLAHSYQKLMRGGKFYPHPLNKIFLIKLLTLPELDCFENLKTV